MIIVLIKWKIENKQEKLDAFWISGSRKRSFKIVKDWWVSS